MRLKSINDLIGQINTKAGNPTSVAASLKSFFRSKFGTINAVSQLTYLFAADDSLEASDITTQCTTYSIDPNMVVIGLSGAWVKVQDFLAQIINVRKGLVDSTTDVIQMSNGTLSSVEDMVSSIGDQIQSAQVVDLAYSALTNADADTGKVDINSFMNNFSIYFNDGSATAKSLMTFYSSLLATKDSLSTKIQAITSSLVESADNLISNSTSGSSEFSMEFDLSDYTGVNPSLGLAAAIIGDWANTALTGIVTMVCKGIKAILNVAVFLINKVFEYAIKATTANVQVGLCQYSADATNQCLNIPIWQWKMPVTAPITGAYLPIYSITSARGSTLQSLMSNLFGTPTGESLYTIQTALSSLTGDAMLISSTAFCELAFWLTTEDSVQYLNCTLRVAPTNVNYYASTSVNSPYRWSDTTYVRSFRPKPVCTLQTNSDSTRTLYIGKTGVTDYGSPAATFAQMFPDDISVDNSITKLNNVFYQKIQTSMWMTHFYLGLIGICMYADPSVDLPDTLNDAIAGNGYCHIQTTDASYSIIFGMLSYLGMVHAQDYQQATIDDIIFPILNINVTSGTYVHLPIATASGSAATDGKWSYYYEPYPDTASESYTNLSIIKLLTSGTSLLIPVDPSVDSTYMNKYITSLPICLLMGLLETKEYIHYYDELQYSVSVDSDVLTTLYVPYNREKNIDANYAFTLYTDTAMVAAFEQGLKRIAVTIAIVALSCIAFKAVRKIKNMTSASNADVLRKTYAAAQMSPSDEGYSDAVTSLRIAERKNRLLSFISSKLGLGALVSTVSSATSTAVTAMTSETSRSGFSEVASIRNLIV